MNKIKYLEGRGLWVNGTIVPDTVGHNYKSMVERIGNDPQIVLTTEVVLNKNVEEHHSMFAFKPTEKAAIAILEAAEFTSRVYNFRLLGGLRARTNKAVAHALPPDRIEPNQIILLVYHPDNTEDQFGFMISYATTGDATYGY